MFVSLMLWMAYREVSSVHPLTPFILPYRQLIAEILYAADSWLDLQILNSNANCILADICFLYERQRHFLF
jgi:hypothetical protein